MTEGYIYVLLNRAYGSKLLKVGMTTKTPEARARELSGATGVPQEFEVACKERVLDCERAERLVHQRLQAHRSSTNREFFVAPLEIVNKVIYEVATEVGRAQGIAEVKSKAEHASVDEVPHTTSLGEIDIVPAGPLRQITRNKTTGIRVTFEDHASYTDAPRRAILTELRSRIWALDDRLRNTERCTPQRRIAYSVPGGRIFMEVNVLRAAIILNLADGGYPDPSGITTSIPETHGWGQLKKRIRILTLNDLRAAIPFIEAAYRAEAKLAASTR